MDFELLLRQLSSDWLGSALAVWYLIFGSWIYVLIWLILVIPVMIKTRSLTIVAVLTLLFSSVIIALMPAEVHRVAYILIVIGVASIMARLFIRW